MNFASFSFADGSGSVLVNMERVDYILETAWGTLRIYFAGDESGYQEVAGTMQAASRMVADMNPDRMLSMVCPPQDFPPPPKRCPHGNEPGDCDPCDVASDIAYDEARERGNL